MAPPNSIFNITEIVNGTSLSQNVSLLQHSSNPQVLSSDAIANLAIGVVLAILNIITIVQGSRQLQQQPPPPSPLPQELFGQIKFVLAVNLVNAVKATAAAADMKEAMSCTSVPTPPAATTMFLRPSPSGSVLHLEDIGLRTLDPAYAGFAARRRQNISV